MLLSASQLYDLSVKDIMDRWPQTLAVFIKHRMLCVGCAVAQFHTVDEACRAHGNDAEVIRNELLWLINGC